MTDENNKALTVQERAVTALGLAKTKDQLVELAISTANLVKITNDDSYKQIHAARVVLKNQRLEITRMGKGAREDAKEFSKAVITEENLLIGIIQPEEERLHKLQKDHDDEVERERQDKIDTELKRVEHIQDRIEAFRDIVQSVTYMGNPTPKAVQIKIDDIQAVVIDASFAEFSEQAAGAREESLEKLRQIHGAAIQREAEDKRLAKEREELAAQRSEQDARDEEERKRQADERAEIDRKAKKLADDQAAFEKEQAEKEEEDRKAEEARQAEIDGRRKKKVEAESLAKRSEYPGEDAIINALAVHFDVSRPVAASWLAQLRQAA